MATWGQCKKLWTRHTATLQNWPRVSWKSLRMLSHNSLCFSHSPLQSSQPWDYSSGWLPSEPLYSLRRRWKMTETSSSWPRGANEVFVAQLAPLWMLTVSSFSHTLNMYQRPVGGGGLPGIRRNKLANNLYYSLFSTSIARLFCQRTFNLDCNRLASVSPD